MDLKVGQKVYVSREKESDSYATSVQDLDKALFLVGIPYLGSIPLILNEGDRVWVTFVMADATYRFGSICRGRKVDQVPLYLLDQPQPEQVERIQRRRMVRVPVTVEVFAEERLEKPEDEKEKHRWLSGDLSGGGMRLICDRPLDPGTWLFLEFSIPTNDGPRKITVLGQVKRRTRIEDKDEDCYDVGVEFKDLPRASEDAIVAYLFRKMIEERRVRGRG